MSNPPSREEFRELQEAVKALTTSHYELQKELSRYRGFVGGVLLVVTALGSVAGLLIKYFKG